MGLKHEVVTGPRMPKPIGPYSHVVRAGDFLFVADPTAFLMLNELYAEFFPKDPPVRSTPIVQLPRGLLISIEAVAVVPA